MPLDVNPIKDILYRTMSRYLSVRPHGIIVDGQPRTTIRARILAHGGARTLYRGRKPHCRSLDSIRSTNGKLCSECYDLKHCTSQIRVHLLVNDHPYCLLLAYTSAKNLLLYVSRLSKEGIDIQTAASRITVVDRGSWGELRFQMAKQKR